MSELPQGSQIDLLPEHQGDPDAMVSFSEIAHGYMGVQTQYGSRFTDGFKGEYPNLGEGLTFEGDPRDYHGLTIRQGDIPTFIARFLEHRSQTSR